MAFNSSISNLTGTSTFYDWFLKENDEIIAKLNLIQVSGVTGGDGIGVSINTSSGLATISVGGTSGSITRGITFRGAVSFLGETVVPNASYKITGITTGTPGYTFGSVVRVTTLGYTAAKANDPDAAEVVGVISSRTTTYSVVTVSGKIDGDFTGVAGRTLSPGCVYFLNPVVSGGITTFEPSAIGYVSKPVIIGLGETAGMVIQYRGNYINEVGTGLSGTNKITISIDKTSTNPSLYGFSAGSILSYGPDLLSGNTFFHQVLTLTGRTAINGYFLSGSRNYLNNITIAGQDLATFPTEEDYIVGMIETVDESPGSYNTYQIITRGYTPVIPKSISSASTRQGSWIISGLTYLIEPSGITKQLAIQPTSLANSNGGVYHAGFVFDNALPPANWFVDLRPLTSASLVSGTITSASSSGSGVGYNYAWNGDFEVHQRNQAKNSSSKDTTASDLHLSDGWYKNYTVLASGGVSNNSIEIYREKFDPSNTDVEGNPKFYLRAKFVSNPASSKLAAREAQIGHFIDDIRSFNGEPITVSFYAKCTYSGYQAKVYIERVYFDTADPETPILLDTRDIGTINLQTLWNKHTLNYTVPEISISSTQTYLGHVRIGINLQPLIDLAHTNAVSMATGLYTDIASFAVYSGTHTNPKHQYESFDNKLAKAQKYYYTTYIYNDDTAEIGSETVDSVDAFRPRSDAIIFTNRSGNGYYLRFPQQMLRNPLVSIYSPFNCSDSINNTMYNYTASTSSGTRRNLEQSNISNGIYTFLTQTRAACGTEAYTYTNNQLGTAIRPNCGAVDFDVLSFHAVADAAYAITL